MEFVRLLLGAIISASISLALVLLIHKILHVKQANQYKQQHGMRCQDE